MCNTVQRKEMKEVLYEYITFLYKVYLFYQITFFYNSYILGRETLQCLKWYKSGISNITSWLHSSPNLWGYTMQYFEMSLVGSFMKLDIISDI